MVPGLILVDLKAADIALSTDVGPRNRPSRSRDTAPLGMIRNGGGQTRSTSLACGPLSVCHFASSVPSLGAIGTRRGLPPLVGPSLPNRTDDRTVIVLASRSTDPQRSAYASPGR